MGVEGTDFEKMVLVGLESFEEEVKSSTLTKKEKLLSFDRAKDL